MKHKRGWLQVKRPLGMLGNLHDMMRGMPLLLSGHSSLMVSHFRYKGDIALILMVHNLGISLSSWKKKRRYSLYCRALWRKWSLFVASFGNIIANGSLSTICSGRVLPGTWCHLGNSPICCLHNIKSLFFTGIQKDQIPEIVAINSRFRLLSPLKDTKTFRTNHFLFPCPFLEVFASPKPEVKSELNTCLLWLFIKINRRLFIPALYLNFFLNSI